LQLKYETPSQQARILVLQMQFYQNGIMRTLITEPDSKRFRIS